MNKEIFRLLKPFIGKASDLLNLKYELKKESGIVQLMPPDKEIADGEYFIGYVLNENIPLYSFGLREKEFLRHILITGSTGTGKKFSAL